MACRSFAFVDSVRTIRISHHRELLISCYKLIDQCLGTLIMHVVVAGAMNNKQFSLQLPGEGDRRALPVLLRMILRQAAVTFLVDRVVVAQVGHRRDRHPHLIKVRIAKHCVESRCPSAAPAPHTNPRRIDERPRPDDPRCTSLIPRIHYSHFTIDNLAPRSASRGRRSAIVHAKHDVALLSKHPMPHQPVSAPPVEHRLRPRLAVNVKQHRRTLSDRHFVSVPEGR